MSDTLIATIGGSIALALWGTSDWLAGRLSKRYGAFEANFALQLPGVVIMLVVMLLSRQHLPPVDRTLIIILAGISFTAAYLCFLKALSRGHVGIVVPLANTFPIITILLSLIFLQSIFSSLQYLSMAIIIAGVVVLAFEKRDKSIPLRILHRETFFALGAAGLWGLGNFIQNIVIGDEPWQVIYGIINITMGVTALILLASTSGKGLVAKVKIAFTNKLGLIAGCITTSGSFGFYIGADKVKSVLIPSAIASAAPLMASFLGAIVDKEKLTLIKRAGAVLVVAGIIMLNIF